MKLGWKSCVDNYESWIDWKNCDSNLKSWVYVWKNCDYDLDVRIDLTLSGHCCFGSIRNLSNFSSQNCTFENKDCYRAMKRPHLQAQDTFAEH